MPSADLAFVLLDSVMLPWIYTHGSGMGTWPGSQCCHKAEGAFGPTLIGVGDAVEGRRGEAQGKGKAALVFLASRRISEGYSACPSWEGTVRI